MGVRRFLAGNVHGVPLVSGVRGAPTQPARLVGAGTGFRVEGRRRHGRGRRARPPRRRRPRAGVGDRRSRAARRARRQLRWLHGGLAALPRPAVRRRRVPFAGHGLVFRAVRQQSRRVGARVPGRWPDRTGRSTIETGAPCSLAERNRTPTLLTAGTRDRATPIGQATEFYRALREHDVPAELALYPLEGHGVRTIPAIFDLVTRTAGWFERFMPPDPAAR